MGFVVQGLLECWSQPVAEPGVAWQVDSLPEAQGLQADAAGDYQAPALIRLRELLSQPQPNLFDQIQALREETRQRLDLMQLSVERGWDEETDPLHQSLRAGFADFDRALELAQCHPEQAEQALFLAQQATNQLALGYQQFLQHAEACSRVHCPRCAGSNPRGALHCNACATPLPRILDETAPLPQAPELELTTPNHDRLVAAVDGVLSGQLDRSGFEAEWKACWANFQGHFRSLQQDRRDVARLSGAAVEAYLGVLDAIEEGLLASLEALEAMGTYLHTGQRSSLLQGLDLLMQATPLLVEAQQLLQSL